MSDISEAELVDFVGPRADYYLAAWRPLRSGQVRRGRFNGAAFFLSGIWLLYRRMYMAVTILMVTVIIESLVSDALFARAGLEVAPQSYNQFMTVLYMAVLGAFGNRWYYWHAVRHIRRAQQTDPVSRDVLARKGGISWLGVALGSVAILLVLILLGAITE